MRIRPATSSDLDWIVDMDLRDEGVTWNPPRQWGESELAGHRQLIRSMVDADSARIADDDGAIGAILWRVRDLAGTDPSEVFRQLDPSVFPADGAFVEIYQLWVAPSHRRRGIASALKDAVEVIARARNIRLIYTHTEAVNASVLALNAKLGYREVRRGPIWDEIVRVSLIKDLR